MAEENNSSIEASKPPAMNSIAGSASSQAATLKLKPVIRKPALKMPSKPSLAAAPAAPVAPAAPSKPAEASTASPIEQLKSMTQKLKGVTQQIPQQAILHKTGIIAEQQLTDAQKLASKSRTSRISLSDAIGASPVQNEAAPMKTIRIKRPVDLNSAPTAVEKPAAVAPEAKEEPAAPQKDKAPTLTQRKTLKISRPGVVRPTGKFAPKKPAAPAESSADAKTEVADIPEIEDMPTSATVAAPVAPQFTKGSEEAPDNIIGTIYYKDFYNKVCKNGSTIRDILKDPKFISDNTNIRSLMKELQVSQNHIAIVIDEFGGVEGLITIEDILEIVKIALNGFEVEVLSEQTVAYKCNCSRQRFENALKSLNKEELAQMADEMEKAETVCQFCGSVYAFTSDELRSLLRK